MDEHLTHDLKEAPRGVPAAPRSVPDRPHISELARNWGRVVALVAAALWSIVTFVWIQFVQPKQVPVNISLNLDMQKVPAGSLQPAAAVVDRGGRPLMAVELSVKATNPSSRSVFLLPSAWIARAYRVKPVGARADFPASASRLMREKGVLPLEKYAQASGSEAVAAGKLFADDLLKPSETISRRIVFHLPPENFDVIEVYTCVPSSDLPTVGVLWTPDGESLHWQITRNGKPVPDTEAGEKASDDYQTSVSRAAMSLWRQ